MRVLNVKLRDHGIPAPADEMRSAAICSNEAGECRVVIAARGYVLIVDPGTGESMQRYFPERYVEYPFLSLGARDGRFYTGAGKLFLALDPFRGEWLHASTPTPAESIMAFSLAEGPDGAIWGATYPHCHLFRYDPATGALQNHGCMDETEAYVFHMAVDAAGWVYLGIGTQRRNLVAYSPLTGERRSLLPESARTRGSGYVHPGLDGAVYAQIDEHWYLLSGGVATPVAESQVAPSRFVGTGFNRIHRPTGAALEVADLNLAERELVVREGGALRRIALAYESEGAALAPMVAGPDGNLWGSSMHPLQLYCYRPREDRIRNFGGRPVEKGGGGNICAWAVQGEIMAGAAYAGGHLHLLDPAAPVTAPVNPRLVSSRPEIHRPRAALAHPDGAHVIWGGFAGYGAVGGALAIHHLPTGTEALLPNAEVVPDQSTLCLGALPGGDLIGGTSVLAPGGAQVRATEACLYRLDWRTRRVTWRVVPVAGAQEIALLQVDPTGLVHALTGDARYFVFDPVAQVVISCQDLSSYGAVVRDGLRFGPDGLLYGLLSEAIYRIDPATYAVTILARPPAPITAGMAILDGRLYFGCGSRLCSYELKEGGA